MVYNLSPELTMVGTLLGPSQVLLTALTVTVYRCPHCKVPTEQLEASVVQLKAVPFGDKTVAL